VGGVCGVLGVGSQATVSESRTCWEPLELRQSARGLRQPGRRGISGEIATERRARARELCDLGFRQADQLSQVTGIITAHLAPG
jgi:hypothetical protein